MSASTTEKLSDCSHGYAHHRGDLPVFVISEVVQPDRCCFPLGEPRNVPSDGIGIFVSKFPEVHRVVEFLVGGLKRNLACPHSVRTQGAGEAGVPDDGEDPRRDFGFFPETPVSLNDFHQRFLDCVFRIFRVVQNATGDAVRVLGVFCKKEVKFVGFQEYSAQ